MHDLDLDLNAPKCYTKAIEPSGYEVATILGELSDLIYMSSL